MSSIPKAILLTGAHRSGTTWVGKMLSSSPEVGYIYEPFNVGNAMNLNPRPFSPWYMCLSDANAGDYERVFRDVLSYRYPLWRNILKVRRPIHAARIVRDQRLSWINAWRHARPMLKDPIAFFSAEWLAEHFDMDVLILVRHPAAFASSIKIKQWTFDFDNWLEQPLLMEKYLSPWENQIIDFARKERDILDQATLLWNCIYGTARRYRDKHRDWLFVRHEDLSADPVSAFASLFGELGLEFGEKSRQAILASSGAHNPKEQEAGRQFVRDSKTNIKNWKHRLTEDEIERVRRGTSEVAGAWYDDGDW
ncbi:MAG: sulfotransferase [Candidatus Sumerlaeia bacterium]